MSSRLSYELSEAVVQACGSAFWLKDPFRSFLVGCGVPSSMYDRYADESKYKIARHVLEELAEMGAEGFQIQRRVVTELAKLRRVPDESVPDMDKANSALRRLKELAVSQKIIATEGKRDDEARAKEARRRQEAVAARAQRMQALRETFYGWLKVQDDPQRRGYGLESLLVDLFELHEITYRPPYRADNEQIDGHFRFGEIDYLVEARWRAKPPTESELAAFKRKVDKKIESTRGLFVSVQGYRREVVDEFARGGRSNIVLMDGEDLVLILEGQVSLTDALEIKAEKAAQEGNVYFRLRERFSADSNA